MLRLAERVLGEQNPKLEALRAWRDKTLAATSAGRHMIAGIIGAPARRWKRLP